MNSLPNLFDQLLFRQDQLEALRTLYARYFLPQMPPAELYDGRATIAIWSGDRPQEWRPGQGLDRGHGNQAMLLDHVDKDPLWEQHFHDLLPHMSSHAIITRMPPGKHMAAHVDRVARPNAIYFPISGCSDLCVSEYYDLPISSLTQIAQATHRRPPAIGTYSINTHAYLTNVHAWHGVWNHSGLTRTAFGWNMRDHTLSYSQHRAILADLGYVQGLQDSRVVGQ